MHIMQPGHTKELLHMSSEWHVKIQDRKEDKSVNCSYRDTSAKYLTIITEGQEVS